MKTRYNKFVLVQNRPDSYKYKYQLLGFRNHTETTFVNKKLHWYSLTKSSVRVDTIVERGSALMNNNIDNDAKSTDLYHFSNPDTAADLVAQYKEAYRKEDELINFQPKILNTWLV